MARAETYLHAKFQLDPSNRLATVRQRQRQTDRQTGQTTVRQHRMNRFTDGRPKTCYRVRITPFTSRYCYNRHRGFWATNCKTVCPMLSDRCLSRLSVCPACDVGVLWSKGCMGKDETLHAVSPWPWPHCVRCGPSSPLPKGQSLPNFWPISVVAKWLAGLRWHLVRR